MEDPGVLCVLFRWGVATAEINCPLNTCALPLPRHVTHKRTLSESTSLVQLAEWSNGASEQGAVGRRTSTVGKLVSFWVRWASAVWSSSGNSAESPLPCPRSLDLDWCFGSLHVLEALAVTWCFGSRLSFSRSACLQFSRSTCLQFSRSLACLTKIPGIYTHATCTWHITRSELLIRSFYRSSPGQKELPVGLQYARRRWARVWSAA